MSPTCRRTSSTRGPTSSGIAIPGTDAWIEGADGKRAAAGEVGELMVRGPHVMQGYWRDPERTAERMRPGSLALGAGARDGRPLPH